MTTRTSQPPTISHKERLLREGMRLVYANGFHGTTVDAVLAASGVPKGSFYHHFGSKEAFTQALLDRYTDYQSGMLAEWIGKDGLSTSDKLTGYFRQMTEHFIRTGYQRACLAGKLSTEVSATSEVFRGQLSRSLAAARDDIAGLIARGQKAGDVRTDRSSDDLADGVLALIQGAFVVALSTRSEHSLEAVTDTITSIIQSSA